jgi:broad specificity phosphatase PhoE
MPFPNYRLTLELVPHCASVARDGWVGSHDDRPLSDEGREQAERLVAELGAGVDAIYSSPALRCRETVAPLARAAGQAVVTLDALAEADGFREPAAWVVDGVYTPMADVIGGAFAGGVMVGAVATFLDAHPGGRVVAASHGDVIPVLLALLSGTYAVSLPEPVARGGWYSLRFADGSLTIGVGTPQ